MEPEEDRFVDRMARILASEGLPPVAGRMWAWLLVCDPPEQTAAQLAEAIGASRGSISGMARLLEPSGLIQRATRRGDRREFCARRPTPWSAVLEVHGAPGPAPRWALLDRAPGRTLGSSQDGSLARLRDDAATCMHGGRGVPVETDRRTSRRQRTAIPARAPRPERIRRLPAVIALEKLTKSYGRAAASSTSTWRSSRARSSASSGPTAPARRRRSARCSTSSGRRRGKALVFGIESTADPVAIHRRIGYLPGEFALYDRLTGGQTLEYFANLRGGVDKAYQASLIERFDLDPSAALPRVLQGQQAEGRPDHRPPAQARAARCSTSRPSGLDPLVQQTFFETLRETAAEGRDASSSRATSCPRSRRAATASRSSATAGSSRSTRVEALRDLAHHQVELRFAGDRAGRRVRGAARASATSSPTTTSCGCGSPARSRRSSRPPRSTSCSTSVAASPASRRRSWPSTAARPSR